MKIANCMASSVVALTVAAHMIMPASAQSASETAVVDHQNSGLDDIIVTARRRSESAQNVPASVYAISAEQLQRQDLSSMEKLASATPQLMIGRLANAAGAQIVLRGIGSNASSIGIEQSVATIVDGAYYGQGRVINEALFDLGSIEVLKGPQALFFGKNATAGVISITTADPGSRFEGRLRTGYEFNAEEVYGEAVLSGPLSDTFGARLALRASKMFGGYYRNIARDTNPTTRDVATGLVTTHVARAAPDDAPGARDLAARLTLKWEPDSNLTDTFKASVSDSRSNTPGGNYLVYRCPNGFQQLNPTIACRRRFVITQNDMPADMGAVQPWGNGGKLYSHYTAFAFNNALNYGLDAIDLTLVTNYQWNKTQALGDLDGESSIIPNRNVWQSYNTKWHAFSTEGRALTKFEGLFNVLVGGYYQKTRRDYADHNVFSGLENSAVAPNLRYAIYVKDSYTKGETLSAYAQVTLRPSPDLEITGGARYTHETKDSFFVQPYVIPAFQSFFPNGASIAAAQRFNNWSPEFTARWQARPGVNFYAAYKTGFKSGGFSNNSNIAINTVLSDIAFGPEKAKGFEVGMKSELFDRQMRFNIAAYTYKYTGIQIDFFNSVTAVYITTNAGSARAKGIEAELQYAPRALPGFSLRGTANYNHAAYIEYDAPCYAGQRPSEGCIGGASGRQNLAGVPPYNAPRFTSTLGVDYESSGERDWRFGVAANARYSNSYLTSNFGNEDSRQPRFLTLDATFRLMPPGESIELAIIGKNLTNRFISTGVRDASTTGSGTGTPAGFHADQYGLVNAPRTVQVQGTYRF